MSLVKVYATIATYKLPDFIINLLLSLILKNWSAFGKVTGKTVANGLIASLFA